MIKGTSSKTGGHLIEGVVYLLHNKVENRFYVGITQNWKQGRFHWWSGHGGGCLANIISKYGYGKDIWSLRKIDEYSDRVSLRQAERAWIKKLNTLWPVGYNIHEGGDGPPYGEDFRRAAKEAQNRPEVKEHQREVQNLPEVKARVIAATKEALNRPEVNQRLREALNRPT